MVLKGRYVGGFADNDFRLRPIILANDFVFNQQSRTLKIRATGGYVGDIVAVGVKSGKSLAVAEISDIGADGTLLVKELEDVNWNTDFVRDLKKTDQKLYFRFVTPPVKRLLGIELSLVLSGGDGDDLTMGPSIPQNVDSNLILNRNGDNAITVAEAEAFVDKAKARIKGSEGLSLGDLAPGIPPGLKVSGVDLSGLSAEEITKFNDIAARVHVVDGRQVVYFQWTEEATPGIRINRLGDIDPSVQFDDFIKEIRDETIVIRPITFPYGPQEYERGPWALPSIYINLVDKARETMVVRGERIASIKRVKKCGKCYYKLELADSGFIPFVQLGKYEDCLAFFWRNAA
jgi:hypothetical protein